MPVRMLVVDDEPDLESVIRQKFRRQIRENEYDFLFAHNGLEAMSALARHTDINLVLSDINMPEMDGLTLLSRLHELHNPLIKAIMVSAYGDMGNIRTAMNRGAFDFVTKPINFTDLEVTINKTLDHIKGAQLSLAEHDTLVAVQRDLSIAARIQQSILPRTFPPFPERKEIEIYAEMNPAREVGGDFYDFFFLDHDRLAFIMADVSGKGVPAAIFMAMSRAVLKTIAGRVLDPGKVMAEVNATLIPESDDAMFVTIVYSILNMKTGELTYCNAGHTPMFLLSAGGEVRQMQSIGGAIVGKLPGLVYKSGTTTISPGDAVFMFTDGVSEAMNEAKDLFGDERLVSCLGEARADSTRDLVGRVLDRVEKFVDGAAQSDDITLMAFRYTGPAS